MVMAWFRLLTSGITARFSIHKKCSHLLVYKPTFSYQIASLHKCVILNNQLNAVEKEFKDESDSDVEANTQKEEFANLKLKILHAGLKFVPEHGWTKNSIAHGAKSLGLSSASHTIIQDGGVDLVHYFNFLCNENLTAYLKEKNSEKQNIQEYIEDALENRLKMVIPFAGQWSEALALMAKPTEVPHDLENLFHLVDTIWIFSGSTSQNTTWYSKRIMLAITYRLCELSLVQDKSPDFSNSFDFLQRRVEKVMNADQILNNVVTTSQQFPNYGIGALITMRNILGLNHWFR